MRSAAFWMMFTAITILAYVWYRGQFYMAKPEPWPTVSGTILSNRIQPVEPDDGQRFKVDLRYRYKRGDSSVEGNRILPDEPTYPSREQAERVAKAFPVGKEVKVYVNPVEKSRPLSVLIWEFPDILSPVVFIVIVLVGTAVVLYVLAEYQRFKK